jgi:serine/threonine protein kinase
MMASSRTSRLIDGRYEVLGTLGEGGMAVVLAARDRRLARDVAVKLLRPHLASDPRLCERFAREAHAAASLNHPNIIEIYDVGVHDNTPYIVMKLISGQTLKQIIATEAPFHPQDVAALMSQIGSALDHAHARGYIHRDIKPGNILIDRTGTALVADFGIAKGLDESDLTDFGGGFGTAAYMAPEQVLGQMATPATDIYSAGVIAFELLTGSLPFAAETPVAMAMRQVHDAPPPPSLVNPRLSPGLDSVVLRSLDKNPTRRWASMHDFAHAMTSLSNEGSTPKQYSEGRQQAPRSNGRWAALGAGVIVLVMAGALIWSGMRSGNTRINGNLVLNPPTAVIETSNVPTAVPEVAVAATNGPQTNAAPTAVVEIAPTIAPVVAAAVTVPDVRGATIPDATRTLLEAGLRIAVNQSEFSNTTPMNAIVTQNPAPGESVGSGGVVRVTLSRGSSPFGSNESP